MELDFAEIAELMDFLTIPTVNVQYVAKNTNQQKVSKNEGRRKRRDIGANGKQ